MSSHRRNSSPDRKRRRGNEEEVSYRYNNDKDGAGDDNKNYHNNNNRRSHRHGHDDFQEERAARMARLRQEMQEEDKELEALEHPEQAESEEPAAAKPQESIIEVNPEELEGLDEEEQMRKLLGIDGFGSTKGQAVEDNQKSAARGTATKNKARKYRQYMNRKNGFNRPLEKMD